MSKQVKNVSKEVKDMYYLLRDIGELTLVYDNMTGDYKKDIDSFAKQFQEIKKAINIDVSDHEYL